MKKINGITSMLFFGVSFVIGFYALWINVINIAYIYILILVSAAILIPYVYCTKCPCRHTSCAHVLPGLITRFMPNRELEPYTFFDWAIVGIIMGSLIVLPQYWLSYNILLLSIFWILLIISFIQIRLFICKICDNKKCMLCGQHT
jgi:hypothetical protein